MNRSGTLQAPDGRPLLRLAQRPQLQHNTEPAGHTHLRPQVEQWRPVCPHTVFSAVRDKVMNNLDSHAAPETRATPGKEWVRGSEDGMISRKGKTALSPGIVFVVLIKRASCDYRNRVCDIFFTD
ncbi:hypothetical protein Vadar_004859 [Vaccinium darrowii]|uniref:Uncharacterized protein n=1 Tax=Vaccinium darrowii TaxID=229202 RepID=A0ACB7ZIK0_9ERIC|nr:hypothetical protein Vadar_004859 [Vaccinium darrowii]